MPWNESKLVHWIVIGFGALTSVAVVAAVVYGTIAEARRPPQPPLPDETGDRTDAPHDRR